MVVVVGIVVVVEGNKGGSGGRGGGDMAKERPKDMIGNLRLKIHVKKTNGQFLESGYFYSREKNSDTNSI